MTEEIPIRIIVALEEESATIPVVEEPVLVPERTSASARGRARQVARRAAQKTGQAVSVAARRVWRSDARRQVTKGLRRGVTAVAVKGSEMANRHVRQAAERQVQERVTAVQTRMRQTDWQNEAKSAATRGLRWLSRRLAALANRLKQDSESRD